MSTKTTFKRVALVAVAALGLGVLSVAPSQAAPGTPTVTITNGTATTYNNYDSSTGAAVALSARLDAGDSLTVQIASKAIPTGAAANVGRLRYLDSTSAANSFTGVISRVTGGTQVSRLDSTTAANNEPSFFIRTSASGVVGANFRIELDSATARTAGTYTFTVTVKAFDGSENGKTPKATYDYDASIVVSAVAAESKVASAVYSTAILTAGSAGANTTVDSAVAAVATASTTAAAVVRVKLKNASDVAGVATESITATITGPGQIGNGTSFGKTVVLQHTAGDFDLSIRPDGTAGVSTINISTPSVTFAPKTITFYAAAPKTITAANYSPVLNVGTNASTAAAVVATAVDANGTNWAGQLYIKAVAAADALIGGSATDPVACSYVAADKVHLCPITTIATGTAKFVVVDESNDLDGVYTAADSAATSNEVTVTVSAGVPTTVQLAFDKATYAPFEKATITVTPLDAAGKKLGTKAITNLFATGGITSNVAFGSASDTLTAVTLTTAAATTSSTVAGSYTYTVYMPAQGDVTISATGGTGLAAAGQVKVSATASIVNSSVDAATDAANEATDAANAATDAALAAADAADAATAAAQDASDAVAALSASVSKMISSLRAQITSLTNLVIKIQKKVRA